MTVKQRGRQADGQAGEQIGGLEIRQVGTQVDSRWVQMQAVRQRQIGRHAGGQAGR